MRMRAMVLAAVAAWLKLQPGTRAALWTLLAGLLFSAMSVLVKLMGTRLDSLQMAFFRAAFGLLTILPFAMASGPRSLRTRRPFAHLIRGMVGAAGMFCGFYSIAHLPLADASAYSFTRPLFLIVLAALYLGERIRLRRISATTVGFVGVVIMLRPSASIEPAAIVALLGAMFVALVAVLIKRLTRTERPVTVMLYFGLISTTIALIPALAVWRQPTWAELGMLMLVGAFGASAQSCMIRGYMVGEATAIAMYDYARLLYAFALGYVIFHEVPDIWTLVGALVIVGATLYIAYREAQLGKRPAAALEPIPPAPDSAAGDQPVRRD